MLSTENPPPDLPCSSQILKSNIVSDDDNQVVVDLFNSGLDDKIPLPNFSIRDYVFNRRGKDIKNHWPFSAKNLQLCLKHGVKDVLPPFHTLDFLRNPSTVKCAVESISDSHVKLSRLSDDHNLPVSSNDVVQNLALSEPEEDKEYPSTSTNQSCSSLNSVPLIKSRYLESEAENSSKKVENSIQNPVKKCKLIVKLSNVVETKSKEEAPLNASIVSETMASKVCPVCKTFSSSSNTTLNAHIDQCLSGESTAKLTTDSKVVKHRIKPRKTKLMVDIYETALHCTLEDLDRRNGTNWASNLGFPPRDLVEEKDKTFSSEDKNKESAVYVDSNGTKLRILSKFSDTLSTSSAKDDCGRRKLVEREKESKFISSKKKKYLVQKHNLLNRPYGQRSCSPMSDHRPEVNNGEQRKFPPEKGYEKEDLTQPLEGCDKMGTDDFGMIKPWVGSKRTGLRKKINPEHETQHPNKAIKNLRLKGCSSSQGDKFIKRSRDLSSPVSSDENPLLSSENHERKENLSCNSHDEYMELPRLRKRQGFSLSESRDFHGKKNRMVREHYTHPPNGIENHTSSQSNKKKRISTGSTVNADRSLISTRGKEFTPLKKTSLDRAILSEGKKFSSSRKNLLSESKKNLGRKHLDLKKRKLHYMSESDEEAVVSRSANDGLSKSAAQKEASRKSSINKCRVLKIRKKSGFFVKMAKEGEMALKGSVKSREFENHGVGKNVDSLEGKNVQDAIKEVEIHEKFVCEPTTNVPDGEAFVDFSKSLNPEFAVLGVEREMLCGDKVGEELVTSNAHLLAEINANEGQGDYFVDVDPIPIPGPPGSFIPSPGRMGSEELQGNSSLTTCRIHSSEDDHELVDMDSSDSPISATSVVSNSVRTQRGISEDRIDLVAENSIRFEEKQKVDEPRANSFFSETSPLGLKNSQPCCCSRKEGVLQSGEESQLLRRRTMTSLPSIAKMGDDPMKKLYDYNLSSETLPEKEQTPEPKNVVANSTTGYCESPSPSTPNPILRLMGKNLMVVNKDENMSPPQIRPPRSNMVNDYPNLRSCIDNGVSSGNIQKGYSFHHTSSRGPPMFDNMQTCIPGQHFGFSSIQDNFGRSFTSSVECREFGGGPGLTRDQLGSKMRLDNHFTYEGEKTRTPPMKEIIVIDDSPEDENMEAGGSRDGISGSMVLGYDTRRVINPIYSYPTRYYPITSGSQMVRNANIQMLPPSKGGINAKWNCTGEGSRTPHPNSLTPSTGHPRSSLYFSHGFP